MISQTLDNFVSQYIDLMNQSNSKLLVEFDKEWMSPCLILNESQDIDHISDGESVLWGPVLQSTSNKVLNSMENIATALELDIPDDLNTFFTRYYSLELPASIERGELSLIQAWNQHDYERLQGNLIAHVMMKRRLKQAETLFFAATDDDDFIISYECASGAIMLEQIGLAPKEKLADTLEEFIASLKPVAKSSSL